MSENREPIFDNDDFLLLLQKYEKMKKDTKSVFFDVEEFEQIIDYFLDDMQFEEATEAAELGSVQHPASVEIKYKFIHICMEQGHAKEAIKVLNEIPSWEHANSEFHFLYGTALCQTGKLNEAEKSFDHALSISSEEAFEALQNIAIAFENARHFRLAIKYLLQAYDLAPDNLSVLYDLGYFHERVDKFEKSISYYEGYLDFDPFSENVWYNLGVVYFKTDHPEKAIDAYEYSIALNPDYASAYFNKANVWASISRFDKAIESFKEFIAIEPTSTQAHCFLGDCYEQIENYDDALAAYQKVIEIDNTESEGWFGAGMIYYQQSAYKEAITYILKALDFDGKNLDYWLNLGYVYEEAEKFNEAIRCYKHITKLDRSDHEAWIALTALVMKEGDYEESLNLLREAYTKFPEDDTINARLAVCHYKLGAVTLSLKFLESALEINYRSRSEFDYYIPADLQNKVIQELFTKYKK
jgi:tetratricopeptide (TPR) repeat protein